MTISLFCEMDSLPKALHALQQNMNEQKRGGAEKFLT